MLTLLSTIRTSGAGFGAAAVCPNTGAVKAKPANKLNKMREMLGVFFIVFIYLFGFSWTDLFLIVDLRHYTPVQSKAIVFASEPESI